MGSALCCPYCAAPITTRRCEYCGRDTEIELVSADKLYDILCDERLMTCDMYARKNALYEGEIGKLNGARIVIKENPSE